MFDYGTTENTKILPSGGFGSSQLMVFAFPFSAWRFKAPQQMDFVEKLTKLVVSQLPNFWKLWISYVNGSLFSEVNLLCSTFCNSFSCTCFYQGLKMKSYFLRLLLARYCVVLCNMLCSFSPSLPPTQKNN